MYNNGLHKTYSHDVQNSFYLKFNYSLGSLLLKWCKQYVRVIVYNTSIPALSLTPLPSEG